MRNWKELLTRSAGFTAAQLPSLWLSPPHCVPPLGPCAQEVMGGVSSHSLSWAQRRGLAAGSVGRLFWSRASGAAGIAPACGVAASCHLLPGRRGPHSGAEVIWCQGWWAAQSPWGHQWQGVGLTLPRAWCQEATVMAMVALSCQHLWAGTFLGEYDILEGVTSDRPMPPPPLHAIPRIKHHWGCLQPLPPGIFLQHWQFLCARSK